MQLSYGSCFKIQDAVQDWKRTQLLATAGRRVDSEEAKFVEKRIKSVPDFGIVAGAGNSKLYRGTALDFYDFVVNQVCALLISFPDSFLA